MTPRDLEFLVEAKPEPVTLGAEQAPLARTQAGPRILGVGTAFPENCFEQEQITGELARLWRERGVPTNRLELLHRNVSVKRRNMALPLGQYETIDTFPKRNEVWTKLAVELGEQAVRRAFSAAGLSPRAIDHVFFTTVTGIAAPSIDARLMNRLGLRPNVKRTPMFGLGCVAGAAGIARAADYLRAYPDEVAVLLSVELCTLTFQAKDTSVANMIATGLFGDGAAAVVLTGARGPSSEPSGAGASSGPTVLASRSVFYPVTEEVMGWEIVDGGFRVVLTGEVPDLVRGNVRRDLDAFLGSHGLERKDIHHWIAHTGGPKVLEAFQEALGVDRPRLARSWRSLEEHGNLSSASVLLVLGDTLEEAQPKPGELGVLLAMGPGFCSELVLLRW